MGHPPAPLSAARSVLSLRNGALSYALNFPVHGGFESPNSAGLRVVWKVELPQETRLAENASTAVEKRGIKSFTRFEALRRLFLSPLVYS
jgi:hypothetical protein